MVLPDGKGNHQNQPDANPETNNSHCLRVPIVAQVSGKAQISAIAGVAKNLRQTGHRLRKTTTVILLTPTGQGLPPSSPEELLSVDEIQRLTTEQVQRVSNSGALSPNLHQTRSLKDQGSVLKGRKTGRDRGNSPPDAPGAVAAVTGPAHAQARQGTNPNQEAFCSRCPLTEGNQFSLLYGSGFINSIPG